MYSSRIPLIFNSYRRSVGFIVRHSNANDKKKYETPADIAKFIEKSARLRSENKNVDYELCISLLEEIRLRINQFTVTEVRTIAYSVTELFEGDEIGELCKVVADFALKRSCMMPICVLSPLVNSVSKMGMKEQSFYNKVIAVLIDRMDEANSMDLATIANTLVLLKNRKVHVDGDVVRSAATAISRMCMRREIMEEMSATNSVLIMYSFAKLEIMDWELFDKLLELMKKINKENFEPHQIPLVLHVFSVFNIKKDARMPLILDYIVETAGIMTYQNIANCLVSLARLNKRRYDVIRALVENLKEKMETIKIRELGKWKENTNLTANILWSLGKLSYNDKEFVDECLRKVAECGDIDAISYAQVFEALKEYKTRRQGNVMLSMKDEELMEHLLNKYMKIMRSSPNQIITQVAWCCSVMDFDRNKVIEESLEELSKRKLNKVEQKYVNLLTERIKRENR